MRFSTKPLPAWEVFPDVRRSYSRNAKHSKAKSQIISPRRGIRRILNSEARNDVNEVLLGRLALLFPAYAVQDLRFLTK